MASQPPATAPLPTTPDTPTPAPGEGQAPSSGYPDGMAPVEDQSDLLNDIFDLAPSTEKPGLDIFGNPLGGASDTAPPVAEPTPSPSAPPEPGAPAAPAPDAAPKGAPAPVPSPAPAPAPAAPAPTPTPAPSELETLRAQVAALTTMLQQAQKPVAPSSPAPSPTGQPGAPAPSGDDQKPIYEQPIDYGLSIPPDLAEALSSEDDATRTHALTFLINGVSKAVHTRVRAEMLEVQKGLRAELGSIPQQLDQQTQIRQTREAYFSRFPTHQNPATELLIQEELAALNAAQPGAAFDANFINALGTRVNNRLATLAGIQPAPSAPAPAAPAAPAARPAPMLPSSGRGPAPAAPAASTQQDLIDDTFSNF